MIHFSKTHFKRFQMMQKSMQSNRFENFCNIPILIKGRNTRTIQLRHLKGIGIGMTPLSDWLNVLPRGSGIAGVTELHYHLKVCHGMLYCTSIKKL